MKKLFLFSALILASLAGRSQNADPLINILMSPPAVQVSTNGVLLVDVINAGTDTVVKNSLEVTIGMSLNGEIIGLASGSHSAWTISSLTTGSGNTIKLQNTSNGIGEDSLQQIRLTVRGNTVAGAQTITGNIVYIALNNADFGNLPNAGQGNLSTSNDNSTTSLAVTLGTPLPVELSSFTGTMSNCQAGLNWEINASKSNTGFILEQSADGKTYSELATVPATEGRMAYSYNGRQHTARSFYRLKMMDNSGMASYSNTISLTADCMQSDAGLSPNPTRNTVRLTGLLTGGHVRVYNQLGAVVVHNVNSADPGLVDLSTLPGGLYRVSWDTEAGVVTRSVTKL